VLNEQSQGLVVPFTARMAIRRRTGPFPIETPIDFEEVASQLVRALRAERSQAAFSRRLGYRSSVAHRWEAGRSWPSASRLLASCERLGIDVPGALTCFFQRRPTWLTTHPPTTPAGVAALLRQLRGKTAIVRLAAASGINRYSLSRWLQGKAEPHLPDFLRLVEAMSRRMIDLLSTLVDPADVPAIADRWRQLDQMRTAAYRFPLSHAVLRALELAPESRGDGDAWLERALGMSPEQVEDALRVLISSGQVRRSNGVLVSERAPAVNTGTDPERAREARLAWTELALERQRSRAPGHFGYSLFAVSKADLRRLRDMHVEYLRAMQDVIAHSERSECVALFCSQMLDLSAGTENALAPR
jgi:transcriptional regulator with XRE-family HTH domain